MIIIGAKGFAKQLVEVFFQLSTIEDLYFFDDIDAAAPESLYGFPLIKSSKEVQDLFLEVSNGYCLGIGRPSLRKQMADKFDSLGGCLTSVISPKAQVSYHTKIGSGATILTGAVIENGSQVDKGVLLNIYSVVHHDVHVGAYSEIGPGAKLLGQSKIEEFCFVGANAVVMPGVNVREHAIVGAGAIVTRDVEAGMTVVGSPAKPLKK